MDDWKKQLKAAYEIIRKRQKAEKPNSNSKLDNVKNFKGRAGYNDVGLPITAKTIKHKNKNKSLYAARAAAKYNTAGSQLRNINEKRKADAIAKYKIPDAMTPDQNLFSQSSEVSRSIINYPSIRTNYFHCESNVKKIYNYYDPIKADDGSIEIIPSKSHDEPKFKNKIEESIYRLSNKK